jgi:hypothetical protein
LGIQSIFSLLKLVTLKHDTWPFARNILASTEATAEPHYLAFLSANMPYTNINKGAIDRNGHLRAKIQTWQIGTNCNPSLGEKRTRSCPKYKCDLPQRNHL